MVRPIVLVLLLAFALACGQCAPNEEEGIVLKGLVRRVPDSEEQIPGVDHIDRLPTDDDPSAIEGVEVIFSSSEGDRDVAKTDTNGRFTVTLPALAGQEADFLKVHRSGFNGIVIRRLRLGAGELRLKRGLNILLIELPVAPCPLPQSTNDSNERPAGIAQ
jgi:hypothetical protein